MGSPFDRMPTGGGPLTFLMKVAVIALVIFLFKSGTDTGAKSFKRVVDWGRGMVTRSNLDTIATQLRADYSMSGQWPSDFPAWIRESIHNKAGDDPALDFWGTLFELTRDLDGRRGAYDVRSCGPDQRCDTLDDVAAQGVAARID